MKSPIDETQYADGAFLMQPAIRALNLSKAEKGTTFLTS